MMAMITTITVNAQNTHWCTDEVTNAALQNSAAARYTQNQLERLLNSMYKTFNQVISKYRNGSVRYFCCVSSHIVGSGKYFRRTGI